MGELGDWANEQSKYIKLGDGESCTGIYKGFNKSSYKGTPLIEYMINEATLSSSGASLARTMDRIRIGENIKITRFGLAVETKYKVEVLQEDKNNGEQTGEVQKAWDE